MSVLAEICARKLDHIAACKAQLPLPDLQERIRNMAGHPIDFIKTLRDAAFPAVIAEVKKASPSKGVIRADFDAEEIARIYAMNGAACLSVLTDEPYFQGRDAYLETIRRAVQIPLLRKDFILDPYQVFESRALGADCILLIMAALSDKQAQDLFETANELGLDTLFEIHDDEELARALSLSARMIGVNNRNLKTLEVDIDTSRRLGGMIPDNILKIAESGLSDFQTLKDLAHEGYGAFLVGESLMRQPDIGRGLRNLRGHDQIKD